MFSLSLSDDDLETGLGPLDYSHIHLILRIWAAPCVFVRISSFDMPILRHHESPIRVLGFPIQEVVQLASVVLDIGEEWYVKSLHTAHERAQLPLQFFSIAWLSK